MSMSHTIYYAGDTLLAERRNQTPQDGQAARFGGLAVFGVWFLCVLLRRGRGQMSESQTSSSLPPKAVLGPFSHASCFFVKEHRCVRANYYVTRSTLVGLAFTARHNRLPCTPQDEPMRSDIDGQVRGGVIARCSCAPSSEFPA